MTSDNMAATIAAIGTCITAVLGALAVLFGALAKLKSDANAEALAALNERNRIALEHARLLAPQAPPATDRPPTGKGPV